MMLLPPQRPGSCRLRSMALRTPSSTRQAAVTRSAATGRCGPMRSCWKLSATPRAPSTSSAAAGSTAGVSGLDQDYAVLRSRPRPARLAVAAADLERSTRRATRWRASLARNHVALAGRGRPALPGPRGRRPRPLELLLAAVDALLDVARGPSPPRGRPHGGSGHGVHPSRLRVGRQPGAAPAR